MRRLINPLRLTLLIVLFAALPFVSSLQHSSATAQIVPEDFVVTTINDRLGIVFVSSAEIAQANGSIPGYRYDRAVSTGVRWNRWPFYWSSIELNDGNRNYTWHENVVNSDVAKGIQINAILMNTPSWATTALAISSENLPEPRVGEGPRFIAPVNLSLNLSSVSPASTTPRNLYTSVFSDNTDIPGPGKTINANNYWARFVYDTVNRFKTRIKVWEMWNEPDHPWFWNGSAAEYARLLKVGYLAAKQADPSCTVLMGGMAYWTNTKFFGQVLDAIKTDPLAPANNYYFDATAWHWYSRSSQMYYEVNNTRNTLAAKGLHSKPIWVNETGVPVYDDPVAPRAPYPGSATRQEAASYVIQSIAYGFAANVQKIFQFQEYDDGNGEIFGLLPNDNNVARPSYTAFQVASQYLSNFTLAQKATDGYVERIIFWGTRSGNPYGKVTVLWNTSPTDRIYSQTAAPARTRAYLVNKAGSITNLSLTSSYSIWLPKATNNLNHEGNPSDYIIGGDPYLLVEEVPYPLPNQVFLPLVYKNGQAN